MTDTNSIKVLVLIPSFAGGGAERTIMNLINNYDRTRFTIKVLLISNEGSYSSSFNQADLIHNQANFFGKNFFWQLYSFVFKIFPFHLRSIKSDNPDIVMTVTESMNYYGYFLKIIGIINCKLVVRSGNNIFAEAKSKGFAISKVLEFLLKKAYTNADHLITISNGGKQSIMNKFMISDENITTIYNPIDLDKINALASSLNLKPLKKPFFLGIGRLAKQKRFDIMIRAFYESKVYDKGYQLVILGQGKQKNNLQSLVDELSMNDHISFMGFQKNPYVYLRFAECFLLSSDWEGFAHVVAEALACDTEVISTNCDFGPKEILLDGKYGEVIPTNDSKAFGNAIKKFIENKDERNYFNKNGRASDFDVRVIIPKYEKLFNVLAKA